MNENKKIEEQFSEYTLENNEYNRKHLPYIYEKAISHLYKIGIPEDKILPYDYGLGVFSRKEFKQCEYHHVLATAYIARVAIESGLQDEKAFTIQDLILQKISNANTIKEIQDIYLEGKALFDKEINEVLHQKTGNRYIIQAKNYIANHIYEKIKLDDIASYIGINPSYLSYVFTKETGKQINHYILEEKIKIASNLLKYTDKSISTIGEYLNITPQSYFTKKFREIMNTTPDKYRKRAK